MDDFVLDFDDHFFFQNIVLTYHHFTSNARQPGKPDDERVLQKNAEGEKRENIRKRNILVATNG